MPFDNDNSRTYVSILSCFLPRNGLRQLMFALLCQACWCLNSILFGISLTVAGCYALLPAYAGGADHQFLSIHASFGSHGAGRWRKQLGCCSTICLETWWKVLIISLKSRAGRPFFFGRFFFFPPLKFHPVRIHHFWHCSCHCSPSFAFCTSVFFTSCCFVTEIRFRFYGFMGGCFCNFSS